MTLSTSISRNDYIGTGSADTFAYDFMILDQAHLIVSVQNTLNAISTLTLGSDYTVTGVGESGGGDVILTAGALANNYRISIRRVVPLTQPTSIRNQGQFFAATHEETFDRLTMENQQQQDEIDRSLKFPETEQIGESPISAPLFSEIPPAASRAGLVLAFDADGNPTAISAVPVGSAAFSAFWLAIIQTADAAAAYAGGLADMFNAYWQGLFTTVTDLATHLTALGFGTAAKFIVEGDLATDSVGTPELIDGAVTAAKIADGAIDASKLSFSIGESATTKTLVIVKTSATVATATSDTMAIGEYAFSGFNKTADITVSGLGGLDTGVEAVSTWYSIWAIVKADGTGEGLLLSASMTTPTMPTGYTGTDGRKVRIGFVYNNQAGDFDDFRIVNDRFQNLVTNNAAYSSWGGSLSWDGNTMDGSVWATQALHPATSPDIETEVFVDSQFYAGLVPCAVFVFFSKAGAFTGSSNNYLGLPTLGGYSLNGGSFGIYAQASVILLQNSSREIDYKLYQGGWSNPSWQLGVSGFRIPAL